MWAGALAGDRMRCVRNCLHRNRCSQHTETGYEKHNSRMMPCQCQSQWWSRNAHIACSNTRPTRLLVIARLIEHFIGRPNGASTLLQRKMLQKVAGASSAIIARLVVRQFSPNRATMLVH
jgi:hypothetical protein